MSPRLRYLLAGLCAGLAGLLTMLYLGGTGTAGEAEAEVIWVARQAVVPGVRLSEAVLQPVQVDGPTRRLLAPEALPQAVTDTPDQWYTTAPLAPGQALVPGTNVSLDPTPVTADGTAIEALRVVSLPADTLAEGGLRVGEEVDVYVIPAEGSQAVRILAQTRVLSAEEGVVTVLVPEAQVADVLTAAEGVSVKVVRRLEGLMP